MSWNTKHKLKEPWQITIITEPYFGGYFKCWFTIGLYIHSLTMHQYIFYWDCWLLCFLTYLIELVLSNIYFLSVFCFSKFDFHIQLSLGGLISCFFWRQSKTFLEILLWFFIFQPIAQMFQCFISHLDWLGNTVDYHKGSPLAISVYFSHTISAASILSLISVLGGLLCIDCLKDLI